MALPLLGGNLFLSKDELILNYWSWMNGFGPYSFLPTGLHDDRPVGWFVVNLMYKLFGASFRPQLMTILVIHWLNALLIFFLANKLLRVEFIAILCAIIFACLYPANSTIFYIGAIFDLMCAFFILLSLVFFLYIPSHTGRIASFLFYYIALRSKEMAFAIPIIFTLFFWAVNFLEVSFKNLFKIVKQLWPYVLVLIMFLIVYIKTGKLGGKEITSSHPYFMDFTIETGYRLLNHYVSRLSWIPEQFHPGMIVLIVLATSITFKYRILTASILSLIAIMAPVLFYPNHIFDIYLYLPNIFFSIMIGSLIKITYEFILNFQKTERKRPLSMVLAITVSTLVIGLTVQTIHSSAFQKEMHFEQETRIPLAILANTLSSQLPTVNDETTFYIANLPYVYRNQALNWPQIRNLVRLVYKNKTLNVATDNMFHEIQEKYNADSGNKIFLLWRNNHFLITK